MKLKYDFEITDFMSGVCAVSKQPGESGKKVIVRLGNGTAVRMFTLIQEGNEIPDIVSTMLKEYDVEEAVLRGEVERFVAILQKDNIV
ncbi:MAG: PqqD family protein [Bacteroidales bacterium]|nr:PqqD family protein [Bacteroidales bacterium]